MAPPPPSPSTTGSRGGAGSSTGSSPRSPPSSSEDEASPCGSDLAAAWRLSMRAGLLACEGVLLVVYSSSMAYASVVCWDRNDCVCEMGHAYQPEPFWLQGLCGTLAGGLVLFLTARLWSSHLRMAAALAACVWLSLLCFGAAHISSCALHLEAITANLAMLYLGYMCSDVSMVFLILLVKDRVLALERSMWQPLGSRCMSALAALALAKVLADVLLVFLNSRLGMVNFYINVWLLAASLALHLLFACLAAAAFLRPLRVLRKAAAALEGSPCAGVQEAKWVTFRQLLGLLLGCVFSIARIVVGLFCVCFARETYPYEYLPFSQLVPWSRFGDISDIAWTLDVLGTALGAVLLSGALRAQRPVCQPATGDRQRQERQSVAQHAWAPCRNPAWHSKVHELAGRAISLGALLDFYASLPSVMPHFAPDRHTTRDVVRQAIIPASRPGRCALASLLMRGAYTRPRKMVSHSWGNLFRDLVAAVVADAMNECCFGTIAHLLDHSLADLVGTLRDAGKLDATYWICAFSVSQHNSICAFSPPHEVDSVTLRGFPGCSCGAPKYLNDHPPLRKEDGKSIPCEMNKFADMMAYLAATDGGFEHVVAMDADFATFRRAWVVAEIAQGHDMGLPQHLKLRSAAVLQAREAELSALDVRQMQASRPEDIREILAAIPDKEAFNAHLQNMIFDGQFGLLAVWRGRDAAQKLESAGRVARLMTMSSFDPVMARTLTS